MKTQKYKGAVIPFLSTTSTSRNRNHLNRNHLEICLSSSKNRNSLAWVLLAVSVCPSSAVLWGSRVGIVRHRQRKSSLSRLGPRSSVENRNSPACLRNAGSYFAMSYCVAHPIPPMPYGMIWTDPYSNPSASSEILSLSDHFLNLPSEKSDAFPNVHQTDSGWPKLF